MPPKVKKSEATEATEAKVAEEEDPGGDDGVMSATDMSRLPSPAKAVRQIVGLFVPNSDKPIETAAATLDLLDTLSRVHPAMRGLQDNPPDLSRFRVDEELNMYLANCLLCIRNYAGVGRF
jgi:hypothetical protein